MRSALVVIVGLVARVAAADPVPQYSIWVGSYICSQGITHLRLTVETRRDGGAASAHFEFGPHSANKSVPVGDYWMTGAIHAEADGRLQLALVPQRWGVHPNGYVMVGLTASSDREQHTLAGVINFDGCSTLLAERVLPEAP